MVFIGTTTGHAGYDFPTELLQSSPQRARGASVNALTEDTEVLA